MKKEKFKKNDDTPSSQVREKPWALILGGSSGLGLATAKKLAGHGYSILIVHRDRKSDLQEIEKHFHEITLSGVNLKTFNQDAIHSDKRAETISKIKEVLNGDKIKVLVHSIAKGNLKPIPELTGADYALTINAMATSLYDWTKALLQYDLFAKDTRIIAFTSEGNTKSWKGYAAVSAAKVVLEAMVRSMALEFAPLGIKANCIQAGVTDTRSFRMIPGHEKLKAMAMKRNPNGRLTQPEDVANAVYLLCQDEAKWINGVVLKVDGGEHLS